MRQGVRGRRRSQGLCLDAVVGRDDAAVIHVEPDAVHAELVVDEDVVGVGRQEHRMAADRGGSESVKAERQGRGTFRAGLACTEDRRSEANDEGRVSHGRVSGARA